MVQESGVFIDPWGSIDEHLEDPEFVNHDPDDMDRALRDLADWLLRDTQDVRYHDRDGWFAELAGSKECEALGHFQDPLHDDVWHPEELHTGGWDFDLLCISTQYGEACSYCEGECQGGPRMNVNLWRLVESKEG